MSLTDEQFSQLIERRDRQHKDLIIALLPAKDINERLIRIESQQQSSMLLYQKMRDEDLIKISSAVASADAAHRRIDKWLVGGSLTVILNLGGMLFLILRG